LSGPGGKQRTKFHAGWIHSAPKSIPYSSVVYILRRLKNCPMPRSMKSPTEKSTYDENASPPTPPEERSIYTALTTLTQTNHANTSPPNQSRKGMPAGSQECQPLEPNPPPIIVRANGVGSRGVATEDEISPGNEETTKSTKVTKFSNPTAHAPPQGAPFSRDPKGSEPPTSHRNPPEPTPHHRISIPKG